MKALSPCALCDDDNCRPRRALLIAARVVDTGGYSFDHATGIGSACAPVARPLARRVTFRQPGRFVAAQRPLACDRDPCWCATRSTWHFAGRYRVQPRFRLISTRSSRPCSSTVAITFCCRCRGFAKTSMAAEPVDYVASSRASRASVGAPFDPQNDPAVSVVLEGSTPADGLRAPRYPIDGQSYDTWGDASRKLPDAGKSGDKLYRFSCGVVLMKF